MSNLFKPSKTLAIDPSIIQADCFEPPGVFLDYNLFDTIGKVADFHNYDNIDANSFIWLRIKSHGTYKIKKKEEIKHILKVLTSHLIEDPTNTCPQIGTLVNTRISYQFTVISTPTAIMPPTAPPPVLQSAPMSASKRQRTGDDK